MTDTTQIKTTPSALTRLWNSDVAWNFRRSWTARINGVSGMGIMLHHILPNVLGPVLVIATINLGMAVLTEATLSFLGVGMPATQPSLGTLIRIGNEYLFSGIWWVVIFPSVVLVALVLAVNLLGDWLRDALNPKLR